MRAVTFFLSASILLGALVAPARGQQGESTDQAVAEAIRKGVQYLWSKQRANGGWDPHGTPPGNSYPYGPGALAMYALLESGVQPQDAKMARALKWQAAGKTAKTYVLGLRANVWELALRGSREGEYRRLLKQDVMQLVKSTMDGSYGYDAKGDGKSRGDNSNSQFGVLGVWAGERANIEGIRRQYWQLVQTHWFNSQTDEGGWGYSKSRPWETKATMTAAGMASMFVCYDNIYNNLFAGCNVGRDGELAMKALHKGLAWFDRNFRADGGGGYYYLYGVERVGLASGYKYFGGIDWYKVGAQRLLRTQNAASGSWSGVANTAFAILFLTRGQNPVLFNKLKFTGDWYNRPRDLASWTRWYSHSFEGTVNWQILDPKVPVSEWHDAPILYISGAKAPTFTEEEMRKLRDFVWQGGTIFSCTECGGAGFRDEIRKVYAKLFPRYEMTAVPADHDLYASAEFFPLRGRPKFHMISNGVRPLVIHTDDDLPRSWQLRATKTQKYSFQAAANVAWYVTGKTFRNRGVTHWPAPASAPGGARTVRVVRLRYEGNYDPEPLALQRFARLMASREKINVQVLDAIDAADLSADKADLAVLTGTAALRLDDRHRRGIKQFVAAGGTVLIDAAGGSDRFADSARKILAEMYGAASLRRLATLSEIYTLKGKQIDRARYRRRTKARLRTNEPQLRTVAIQGRAGILFSREDITGGLVGYSSHACQGYAPSTAYELMRNISIVAAKRPTDDKP